MVTCFRIINGRKIVTLGMAVVIAVGSAYRESLSVKKDEGGIHVIRKETDINLSGDELHGDIIADLINRYGGILADLSGDSVEETFIKPFP